MICFINAQELFDKVTKINKTYLILDLHLKTYSRSTLVMLLYCTVLYLIHVDHGQHIYWS